MSPIFLWYMLWNPAFSHVATPENLRCFCDPEKNRVDFTERLRFSNQGADWMEDYFYSRKSDFFFSIFDNSCTCVLVTKIFCINLISCFQPQGLSCKVCQSLRKKGHTGCSFWDRFRNFLHNFTWFFQFISWTNWVNSGKSMDSCWISCQVMAEMKKVYDDLIIIRLY